MARGRIAGITIEIGGDTTKLQTALKDVDKHLNNTQKALRDTNKLLKLDPANTELLTQKQKLLKDAIDGTKGRLDTLKEALKQATPGTAEYDALQREIADTEQTLKSLKGEYSNFGSVASQVMKAAGEKMKEAGRKVSEFGKELSVKVTAPLVALGGASIAAFNEVRAGEEQVITKTGATGEALEEMTGIMEDLATSIPTSFEEAGSAVGEVATRFDMTGDQLKDLSGKFIKFSKVNKTDVSKSIDTVQSAMAMFGVESEKAGDVLDMLTKASQDTGIGVDELSSSLSTNGVALQEMGMGIEDAIGFLANLDKSGVDSSATLSGLKKAVANAAKEGKPMAEAMHEVQDAIKNAGSDTEATQAAIEIFGSKAGPAIAEAVRDGKLSLEDFSGALVEFQGATEETFDATIDAADEFQVAMNKVKDAGAELGEVLGEKLAPIVGDIADMIKDLGEKFEGLDPDVQDLIVTIGLIVAAAGPVLVVIGTVIGAIGSIVGAIGTVIGVITAVTGAIGGVVGALNPIVWVIAGVIAAGVALWANWDTIKEKAGELKDKVEEKWNDIKEKTVTKFNEVKENIQKKMQEAKEKAIQKASDMKTNLEKKFGDIKDKAKSKFEDIKKTISDKMNGAKDKVKEAIDKIKGFFNFKVSFPHINLPHFSVSGSANPLDWLSQGVPKISVKWYKKAMQNPMILDGATIFGAMGDSLLGGGESGREAIMSVETMRKIAGSDATIAALERNYRLLERYLPALAQMDVVMDTGATVGALAPGMNKALGGMADRSRRR